MSMTDPIADLLTRIRNASKAHKNAVDIPASNIKREIVRILKEQSFVKDMVELPDNKQGILRVYLLYSRGDVPVLKSVFPRFIVPPVHIDLRWVLRRLGHKGGLKRIEKSLGLSRPDHVGDMDGYMAVMLWQDHLAGDPDALATLLDYNACDIVNLEPLLNLAVERLRSQTLGRLS